jgi:hypothetical protein
MSKVVDNEWQMFLSQMENPDLFLLEGIKEEEESKTIPSPSFQRTECEELYISTQTQIFFLNQTDVDVDKIFWNTTIIPYGTPENGVVKKQMRMVFKEKPEFEIYQERIKNVPYYTEKVIKQIDNPNARKIKFKDVRKITIGISKKDIMNCHGKNKSAFINCFAMIMRVKHKNRFHEIHVKVFNTGKMAIPGIVDDDLLESTKILLLNILQPNFSTPLALISANDSPLVKRLIKNQPIDSVAVSAVSGLPKKIKSHFEYVKAKCNVLINSNFNCGYYIQQEKIKAILRDKYKLNPTYDPSMYPGVKCKFYYNNELEADPEVQNGRLCGKDQFVTMSELDELTHEKYTKVSFMIFRTGNCLIVGNCSKPILMFVFDFVKGMLMREYEEVRAVHDIPVVKLKKNKPRKRNVTFTPSYFDHLRSHI